jgi:hypothetical protein
MNIHIYRGHIEELASDLMILPFFSNERPLKSITGLIDWRLNGKLSKLIMSNIANGSYNEKIMFAPHSKIKISNFLLFGLGIVEEFSLSFFEDSLSQIFSSIEKLNVNNFAIPIGKFMLKDVSLKETAGIFLMKLAQRKKEHDKLASDCYIVIRHEEELKDLAVALKRLNGNLPIDIKIDVITNI